MKTYEEAVLNQWAIAHHRTAFAKEAAENGDRNRSCNCAVCKEHFDALKLGPQNGDSD